MDMNKGQKIEAMFNEAESLYNEAIEMLKEGKIRDATKRAWTSTVKATSALILAKTGIEIDGLKRLIVAFRQLSRKDKEVEKRIKDRFFTQQQFLSGCCTYIDSREQVEEKIKETIEYIKEARRLAGR